MRTLLLSFYALLTILSSSWLNGMKNSCSNFIIPDQISHLNNQFIFKRVDFEQASRELTTFLHKLRSDGCTYDGTHCQKCFKHANWQNELSPTTPYIKLIYKLITPNRIFTKSDDYIFFGIKVTINQEKQEIELESEGICACYHYSSEYPTAADHWRFEKFCFTEHHLDLKTSIENFIGTLFCISVTMLQLIDTRNFTYGGNSIILEDFANKGILRPTIIQECLHCLDLTVIQYYNLISKNMEFISPFECPICKKKSGSLLANIRTIPYCGPIKEWLLNPRTHLPPGLQKLIDQQPQLSKHLSLSFIPDYTKP